MCLTGLEWIALGFIVHLETRWIREKDSPYNGQILNKYILLFNLPGVNNG